MELTFHNMQGMRTSDWLIVVDEHRAGDKS
jgi:hypothetical protein